MISECNFFFFSPQVMLETGSRAIPNEEFNLKSNFSHKCLSSQFDNTERRNVFRRRACQVLGAGRVIPSGIIVVGGGKGVSHPDGSRGRGRRSFTFNCCFILPTIFFHHCNLEAETIHSDELFLDFNWNWWKWKKSLSKANWF